MPVQGVKGLLFELLSSSDKSAADFMATLKPGDTLKGRIMEILPADNKAVINFKGYNMVSVIPEGMQAARGDVINVSVTQTGTGIFMKVMQDAGITELAAEAAVAPRAQDLPAQLLDRLAGLKIPANEQNLLIARKLIDYGLPVTPENVKSVNTALTSYLEQRGIDERIFTKDGLAAAKDIAVTNFFRLGSELGRAAETLRNMAQIMESSGARLLTRTDIAIRTLNVMNIVNAAAAASGGEVTAAMDGSSALLTVKGSAQDVLPGLLAAAVREGAMTGTDAERVIKEINNGAANLSVSRDVNIRVTAAGVEVKYANMVPSMNALAAAVRPEQAAALKEAAASGILGNYGQKTQAEGINEGIISVLGPQASAALSQARQSLASLIRNINEPGDTTLGRNAAETGRLIKEFESAMTILSRDAAAITKEKAGEYWNQAGRFRSEVIWSLDSAKAAVRSLGIQPDAGLEVKPAQYAVYMENTRDLIARLAGTGLFQETGRPQAAAGQVLNIAAAVPADVESVIESVIFLKSRGLPDDNKQLVDIMTRFFREDMKLSSSLENLSRAAAAVEGSFKTGPSNVPAGIIQAATDLKSAISEFALKTDSGSLKPAAVEKFLLEFRDRTGIIPETAPKDTAEKTSPGMANHTAGESLKSRSLGLVEMLSTIDTAALTAQQKHSLRGLRDAALDVITNINALSIMNHKPVAFDMNYTQIPVFFGNRLFNGELQVWYRKGAPKEELRKADTPVNMVFMLNTTNLGPVKVSMTVFKNEVECSVTAGSEKAKQALMRSKEDFLGGLGDLKYNMKNFSVKVDGDGAASAAQAGGYTNAGGINLRA